MKLFEYMNRKNMERLEPDQQKFISKMIKKEVEKTAKEKEITEEQAYYWMSKGLYGGDRDMDFSS